MKRRAGFTLMEVLIALAIVAILAGTAGLAVLPNLSKGKFRSAQFQVEQFKSALEQYLLDNGAPPTRQQGLAALVAAPTLPPVPASFPAGGYLVRLPRPRPRRQALRRRLLRRRRRGGRRRLGRGHLLLEVAG